MNVLMTSFADRAGERFAGDSRYWRLAGCVDIGQDQDVGLVEGATEFVPEMLGARIAVRLEEDQQAVKFAAARSLKRGADFRWMVAIVVDDGDVVHRALDVKTPAHSAKFC